MLDSEAQGARRLQTFVDLPSVEHWGARLYLLRAQYVHGCFAFRTNAAGLIRSRFSVPEKRAKILRRFLRHHHAKQNTRERFCSEAACSFTCPHRCLSLCFPLNRSDLMLPLQVDGRRSSGGSISMFTSSIMRLQGAQKDLIRLNAATRSEFDCARHGGSWGSR